MKRHIIKFEYENGVKLSAPVVWCGRPATYSQWLFQDAQHAALSVNGEIEPCRNCVKAIIKELEKVMK